MTDLKGKLFLALLRLEISGYRQAERMVKLPQRLQVKKLRVYNFFSNVVHPTPYKYILTVHSATAALEAVAGRVSTAKF